MATKRRLPPSAASLTESMRDLGYTLSTAIADIVDNSIAAGATEVNIFCVVASDNPALAIIDNGTGMSSHDLLNAMKHGSISPKKERSPQDLGRFGLGLKTASFSQCRHLSVISSQKSKCVGADWDLELVEKEDDWIISVLDEGEIADIPFTEYLSETGTAVIWRNLDRLFEGQTEDGRDEIVNEKLDLVEKHLALVFHRFLAGEIKNRAKLSISINGHIISPFDPFCRKNKATRVLPKENIRVDGQEIRIQPYILPHHSRLTAGEYDYYEDRSNYLSNQGTYIYRNGRLMAWGDWFRLVSKGEATKYARVCIDFPNSLDEKWTIDIKKSKASPPPEIRQRVKQIILKIADDSKQISRGRGKKLFHDARAPIWERFADSDGIRYGLNSGHPLLTVFEQSLTNDDQKRKFRAYIKSVISSLPVEMIYSDFSNRPREIDQSEKDKTEILEQLRSYKNILEEDAHTDQNKFREIVDSTRLFQKFPDVVEEFIEGEFHGK